jgi:biopolymer transport protein ExbD
LGFRARGAGALVVFLAAFFPGFVPLVDVLLSILVLLSKFVVTPSFVPKLPIGNPKVVVQKMKAGYWSQTVRKQDKLTTNRCSDKEAAESASLRLRLA